MGRLVCLYFEENEVADGFVNGGESVMVGSAAVPLAVFAVPTKFCECPKVDKMPITRGANLGWWIHKQEGCYKPIKGSWQSPRNLLLESQVNVPIHERKYTDVHVSWTYSVPFQDYFLNNSGIDSVRS